MTDNINIKTNTKNRLKKLFHNLTYNIMIDKLIWSNYCLKYLIIKETPNYEYIENYQKSNSKWTKIKVSATNKEILDNMRAALYKPSPINTWELGNDDPNKQRTYSHVEKPTDLVKPKKTYDQIINELIDNYQPHSLDLAIRGDVGNQVRFIVDDQYNGDLITLRQHTERIEAIERFAELGILVDDDEDDDYYEQEYDISFSEVLKNIKKSDSVFEDAKLEASKQHQF